MKASMYVFAVFSICLLWCCAVSKNCTCKRNLKVVHHDLSTNVSKQGKYTADEIGYQGEENDNFGTCDDFTSSWYQLPTSHWARKSTMSVSVKTPLMLMQFCQKPLHIWVEFINSVFICSLHAKEKHHNKKSFKSILSPTWISSWVVHTFTRNQIVNSVMKVYYS